MGLLNAVFNQVLLVDLVFHFQHLHKHRTNDETLGLNIDQENCIHIFTYQDKKYIVFCVIVAFTWMPTAMNHLPKRSWLPLTHPDGIGVPVHARKNLFH